MKNMQAKTNKPELLLPAGSTEAFLAALEGGADAVYLGMQQFNARGRARNFNIHQLPTLINKAKEFNAKLYITLNTLIKNKELQQVLDYLQLIEKACPAAIIIQDWGIYQLCRKYFPKLKLHASTQMGNHNALDCSFSKKLGFERVILARELTLTEIDSIAHNSSIQLEIFVHGALCYSFSGSCLFSSWSGGMSANRGQCRQPCRHLFNQQDRKEHFFSMKDLQLIDYVPALAKLGISALKIEGRMRSAEYVFQVASAYRLALDYPDRIEQAKAMLINDGGRDKTTWYFTGNSSFVTTGNTFTGKGIGSVIAIDKLSATIELTDELKAGTFVRFHNENDLDSEALPVNNILLITSEGKKSVNSAQAGDIVLLSVQDSNVTKGSIVYQTKHTSNKKWFWKPAQVKAISANQSLTRNILSDIYKSTAHKPTAKQNRLIIRVNDPDWLPMLNQVYPVEIIIPINAKLPFQQKTAIELPFFTAEDELPKLKEQIAEHIQKGFGTFYLSRLSQMDLFNGQKGIVLKTNEQVYALNDAVLSLLKEKGIADWILPLENDYPNLIDSSNRNGIVPLFYHPKLFYSRQTVKLNNHKLLHGKESLQYQQLQDMVQVTPEKPVCNFNFVPKLSAKGYHKYLIDLSDIKPDKAFLTELIKLYQSNTNLKDTTRFNLKQGLW